MASNGARGASRLVSALVLLLIPAAVVGQQSGPALSPRSGASAVGGDEAWEVTETPGAFGPFQERTWVTAAEFRPIDHEGQWDYWSTGYWYNPWDNLFYNRFVAPLGLPEGALIYGFYVHAFDSNENFKLDIGLWRFMDDPSQQSVAFDQIGSTYSTSLVGTPGYVADYLDVDPNHSFITQSGSEYYQYAFVLDLEECRSCASRGSGSRGRAR